MQDNLKACLVILVMALCSACQNAPEPASLTLPAFYNLDTLLAQQITMLTANQKSVVKIIDLNSEHEQKALQTVNWQNELTSFTQASISRPAWRRDFEPDTVHTAKGYTVRYKRKPSADALVEFLQVAFMPDGHATAIQAAISADNMLFYTRKQYQLSINPGTHLLNQYEVSEVQKTVFSDSSRSRVQGIVQ